MFSSNSFRSRFRSWSGNLIDWSRTKWVETYLPIRCLWVISSKIGSGRFAATNGSNTSSVVSMRSAFSSPILLDQRSVPKMKQVKWSTNVSRKYIPFFSSLTTIPYAYEGYSFKSGSSGSWRHHRSSNRGVAFIVFTASLVHPFPILPT